MRLLTVVVSTIIACARALTFRSDADLVAEYGPPVPLPPPAFLSAAPRAGAASTLRAAAAARGIYIGSAINEACWKNTSEPYATTYLTELSLATCENGCKFAALEPSQGSFSYAECDFISNAALNTGGGAFRGHNFVWGQGIPSWVSGSGDALKGIINDHITQALGHYSTAPFFECWDVVNEAVCDTGSSEYNCSDPATLWKTNTWTPAGARKESPKYPHAHPVNSRPSHSTFPPGAGTAGGYVEVAFDAAERSVKGATKLFYNDYGGEAAGTPKSDKIYEMLKDFKARGVPVSGVGLQMHISSRGYPSPWDVASNIKRLGALGLEVHITEMDVRCAPPCDLNLQASIYGNMLSACLNNSGVCKSFETWGFTDAHTWLSSWDNPNHTDFAPLPFGERYEKKPAYFELLAVLNAAESPSQAAESFMDVFNRPDGTPLGPPAYLTVEDAAPLVISSHQVCSADHGIAVSSMVFSPSIAINVTFVAHDVQGQEAYALVSTDSASPANSSPLLFAGCDGGNGQCTPTIGLFNSSTKARAEPIQLRLGAAVRLNVAVAPSSSGDLSVSLRIVDDASGAPLGAVDSVVTVGTPLTHAGFIVGRGFGKPSCVTKLDITSDDPLSV